MQDPRAPRSVRSRLLTGFGLTFVLSGSLAAQTPPQPAAPNTPAPASPISSAAAAPKPAPPVGGNVPKTAAPALSAYSNITLAPNPLLPTTLNCQTWNGLLVTNGGIGRFPIERFVIATGLNVCVITPDAQTRMALPSDKTSTSVSVLDLTRPAPTAQATDVTLGLLRVATIPMATLDVLGLLTPLTSFDAPAFWLGTSFLSAFQVTLDYPNRTVTLARSDAPFPKDKGTIMVPFEMQDGRPYVKVSIARQPPFLALLDTATVGTLLPASVGAKLKGPPLKTVTLKRGDKTAQAALVVLPALKIGKAEQDDIPALYLTGDTPPEFHREMGVIGLDFLSHFKVTLNYKRMQVAFAPPVRPATPKTDPDDTADPAN